MLQITTFCTATAVVARAGFRGQADTPSGDSKRLSAEYEERLEWNGPNRKTKPPLCGGMMENIRYG